MRLAIHLFVLIMWALSMSAIRVLPRQKSAYLLKFFSLYCLWVVFSHCILKLLYEASFLVCDIQQTFLTDFYWNPTKMWKINLGFSFTEKVSSITLLNMKMCFLSPTYWWMHNLDIVQSVWNTSWTTIVNGHKLLDIGTIYYTSLKPISARLNGNLLNKGY